MARFGHKRNPKRENLALSDGEEKNADKGKERSSSSSSSGTANGEEERPWVQCSECEKWR